MLVSTLILRGQERGGLWEFPGGKVDPGELTARIITFVSPAKRILSTFLSMQVDVNNF